ncbi:MAG TPA: hypothetical protein VJZ00_20665 [Thermoanaerobaculia bacterium]|nr:hypothetical protein [Thermoanaerobaculia bacterium]
MVELYPQLVVGGFETVRKETREQFFPTLADVAGPSALYTELDQLRVAGAPLDAWKDVAQQALTCRPLASDGRVLLDAHRDLDAAASMLDASDVDCAIQRAAGHAESTHDLAYIGDSLLANLVLAQNQLAVEAAHRLLKVAWIVKSLSKGWMLQKLCRDLDAPPSTKPDEQSHREYVRRFWRIGAISIPLHLPAPRQGAWPAAGYLEAHAQSAASEEPEVDVRAIATEAKALREARADLERAEEAQRVAARNAMRMNGQFTARLSREDDPAQRVQTKGAPADQRTENPDKNAPALSAPPSVAQYVSPQTKEALAALGVDIDSGGLALARSAIDRRFAALQSKAGRPVASVPVIQVGSVIVEANPAAFAEILCGEPEKRCHCELLRELARKHGEKPQVRLLGTGFAFRIRQHLKRYLRSELVHTEPVLGQTERSVSFRDLNRVEEFQETLTSRETFDERETTSHDQFEFASEVAQQTAEEHKASAGMTMSASYGTVSVSGSVSASTASASSEATQTAVKNAKEVMVKAVKRIQEKVQERRSILQIRETERKNSFSINNVGKPSFTGFYYAIDKEYENQLIRVGKRLMVRFAMQQPMAFLLHCLATARPENSTLEKPIAPSELNDAVLGNLTSFLSIDATNYAAWAALYDAEGVKPPPANVIVSHGVANDWPSKAWVAATASIEIPEGYEAVSANVSFLYSPGSGRYVNGFLGTAYFTEAGGTLALDREQGKITTTWRGNVEEYALNYVITCAPSAQMMTKWKIDTYKAILDGYNKKKSAYDSQVQVAGIEIEGRNPLINRKLVEEELQKFVLGALYPPFYYRGFDSIRFGYQCGEDGRPVTGAMPVPEPDFKDAYAEMPWVTFFLALFEWKNMTYQFLPYDFGKRERWCTLRRLQDVDAFFESAITAGYVVVDVPVSAQMTNAFLHFYQTQEIWNGGDMPVYGDPMFQEIAISIKESENLGDGEVDGSPWTTIVPTPLVYVKDDPPADL